MKSKMVLVGLVLGVFSGGFATGTWTVQNSGITQNLLSIDCPTSTVCHAVGGNGRYLKITGTGSLFTPGNIGIAEGADLYGVVFLDSLTGYAVQEKGVEGTGNGGGNWDYSFRPYFSGNFNAGLIGSAQSKAYIAGWFSVCASNGCTFENRIVRVRESSEPQNMVWHNTSVSMQYHPDPASDPHIPISALFFVDTNHIYAALGGKVCRSINEGAHTLAQTQWDCNQVSAGTLHSMQFLNSSQGIVMGDSGYMYRTIDGGAHWNPQARSTTKTLRAVHFIDANTGYAVGDSGTILESGNGGATWTVRVPVTTANLNALAFLGDGSTGYAVGDGGTVLKLTGGTPTAVVARKRLNPEAGIRRIGTRWYGFSVPDGRAFDTQGRQMPLK